MSNVMPLINLNWFACAIVSLRYLCIYSKGLSQQGNRNPINNVQSY